MRLLKGESFCARTGDSLLLLAINFVKKHGVSLISPVLNSDSLRQD